MREKNNYPPFTRLCLIESKNENEKNARGAITDFYNILIKKKAGLIITSPTPALIARIKGQYRFHLLVKSPKKNDSGGKFMRDAITESWIEYNQRSKFSDIRLTIDMDPQGII